MIQIVTQAVMTRRSNFEFKLRIDLCLGRGATRVVLVMMCQHRSVK